MFEKKILVVDDEKDTLALLEKRLTVAGYVVIKADNGKDAISLAKTSKPDLILLDIMMPIMDGGEVAAILKNDPATKDIPVIFLTCLFTKTDEAQEGHTSGGNFFIAKPYNPQELLGEIKQQLRFHP